MYVFCHHYHQNYHHYYHNYHYNHYHNQWYFFFCHMRKTLIWRPGKGDQVARIGGRGGGGGGYLILAMPERKRAFPYEVFPKEARSCKHVSEKFRPMQYGLSPAGFKRIRKLWLGLPFSQARITSDENIWMFFPFQFHFQFIIGYELKTVCCLKFVPN